MTDTSSTPPASPPRRTLTSAVKDRPWLVVFCALALAALGAIAGMVRPPMHSAEARVAITRIDVSTQSLPGFAIGSQNIAVAYSRMIDAQPVVEAVAKKVGISEDEAAANISASPIPESPLVRILATGPTSRQAVQTANAAADSLRAYVAKVNSANPDADRLFRQFRQASAQVDVAQDNLRKADPDDIVAVRRARAQLVAAQLKRDTVRSLYQQTSQSQASVNSLQVVTPARTSLSDKGATVQRYLVLGLIGGLLLGAVLCYVLAGRDERTPSYRPRHAPK